MEDNGGIDLASIFCDVANPWFMDPSLKFLEWKIALNSVKNDRSATLSLEAK